MTAGYLRTELRVGEGIGHWRLGRLHEERFDVADRPMQGRMDALFFLAKERNFIPHEYPCRIEFAARYRDRPPQPTTAFEPQRAWLPFGSPRLDLSGFWFRPTRVECWAETTLESPRAQTARVRFSTCGGALLFVDGVEVAALSGYRRNFEESVEAVLPLSAGRNEVRVWFADLCERDTRYYVAVELLEGEGLTVALPVGTDGERAAQIERLLAGMRFERSFYGGGEVAILFPEAAAHPLDVEIRVRGDFMSTEAMLLKRRLGAGERRLVVGPAEDLPADFRHFDILLRDGGFEAERVLAVEICHLDRLAPPPPTIAARAGEALAHVADHGEEDTVRALALLALGRGGAEADAMIGLSLPAIRDLHDCADFLLVPLLWCRMRWPEAMSPQTREEVDAAILAFRYWMDEPGNDVMWYFSENHALLFHTACYLAGTLFPDEVFRRSGRRGRDQAETGRRRLREWLDHFEACEMAEWNSAPYFPIDLKGLCALYALAPDADIRVRAGAAIRRLLEIVALSSHQGLITASQGRSYEHTLRPGRSLELSAIARLAFGRGWYGRRFHALPQLALCLSEHGLEFDRRLAELALFDGEGGLEWRFRQGENGFAALYHYKTRDYAMGSLAAYRWGEWGYQETVLQLRLGERPEAQIWINHPGELIHSGYARPSYWGGCGTLPRVHQYRALALVDFAVRDGQPDFTHAWLPAGEFDEVAIDGDRILVRCGAALALLVGDKPFAPVAEGPTAGCEVRLPGRDGCWLVRLSDLATEGSLAAFGARFAGLAARAEDGALIVDDADYGTVRCLADGAVAAEGRRLDPAEWRHAGELLRFPEGRRIRLPSHEERAGREPVSA